VVEVVSSNCIVFQYLHGSTDNKYTKRNTWFQYLALNLSQVSYSQFFREKCDLPQVR